MWSDESAKIKWLLENPSLWETHFFSAKPPLPMQDFNRLIAIADQMIRAKLYTPRTSRTSIIIGILQLIAKAREARNKVLDPK